MKTYKIYLFYKLIQTYPWFWSSLSCSLVCICKARWVEMMLNEIFWTKIKPEAVISLCIGCPAAPWLYVQLRTWMTADQCRQKTNKHNCSHCKSFLWSNLFQINSDHCDTASYSSLVTTLQLLRLENCRMKTASGFSEGGWLTIFLGCGDRWTTEEVRVWLKIYMMGLGRVGLQQGCHVGTAVQYCTHILMYLHS